MIEKGKSADSLPERIGPYSVECLLQSGGMSLLYLGTHPDTKEPTAIKVLSPQYLSHSEAVDCFFQEAQIIAMADHPNVVKLYGHGRWEGGLYIAMEFIEGVSLRQYLLQHPLSLRKALEMVTDILYALCHLHAHGIIHRDLKPENILVNDSGQIKLIDFGIAQLLTHGNSPSEEESEERPRLMGTPIYMSPEQRDDPHNVGYASDLYSLAIIAYELILGRLSFGKIQLSRVPRGLQKIFAKCLQPDPKERYQDVVDLISDLADYVNSSAFERDRAAGDELSELSESLQLASRAFMPPAPIWEGLECAIINQKQPMLAAGFYEAIAAPSGDNKLLIAGCAKGVGKAGDLLYTAVWRGYCRAAAQLGESTEQFFTYLHRFFSQDTIHTQCHGHYLLLQPKQNRYVYVNCGYGPLLHLPADKDRFEMIDNNSGPFIERQSLTIQIVERSWNRGDLLLLLSGTHEQWIDNSTQEIASFIKEPWWCEPFVEGRLALQQEMEAAYRRAWVRVPRLWQNSRFSLIGLRRHS